MNQLLAATLLAVGTAASAQTVLYDTFNEADQANLFDCCNALTIGSLHGHDMARVKLPFTVPVKTHIIEIDIPVSFVDGRRNGASINIGGDHGHKHTFDLNGLDAGGQCCAFRAVEANVAVAPGGHYTLQLKANMRSIDTWNLNSAGITGTYEVSNDNGETWTPVEGILPAVRIIGE